MVPLAVAAGKEVLRSPGAYSELIQQICAHAVEIAEGNMVEHADASARTPRRGQRPWHVPTLLAREPGDLASGRRLSRTGPHREGEEP